MAGAIDKYFQIARCYRDEGSRPDRQPEFTQLDIEMSFTNVENVIKLIEDLLGYCWPAFLQPLPLKFPRMTYWEAMEQYGTDQPDIRYEFKVRNGIFIQKLYCNEILLYFQLKKCTDLLKSNEKLNKTDNFGAYCLVFPKQYSSLTKTLKEQIAEKAAPFKSVKLVQNKVPTIREWVNKVGKLITPQIANQLSEELKLDEESIVFLCFGDKIETVIIIVNRKC